jgi:hypothetical protein
VVVTLPGTATPALFTNTSSRPCALTAAAIRLSTSAESETSARTAVACPPASAMAATVPAAALASMSPTTAVAPSVASRVAMARPIPAPAPVTTATIPSKRRAMNLLASGARPAGPLVNRLSYYPGVRGAVNVAEAQRVGEMS